MLSEHLLSIHCVILDMSAAVDIRV